ncbi:hypothetical protein PR202_gb17311 [Eleusine coracana subsp. coracana]|uniref:Uncharacterized protein n=1 Tax=Eleusine coracana subsp. coracana TaxID=191504 RepID=A0AAV5F2L3_ELECO|nr:hypothetical protein PR202_gb17311 [Eleusine coracana subsp. coracana]
MVPVPKSLLVNGATFGALRLSILTILAFPPARKPRSVLSHGSLLNTRALPSLLRACSPPTGFPGNSEDLAWVISS